MVPRGQKITERVSDVRPAHVGHWQVDGDVLHYDGQATERTNTAKGLWTKVDYTDAAVYVEWRFSSEPKLKPHPIVLRSGDFLHDEEGKRVTLDDDRMAVELNGQTVLVSEPLPNLPPAGPIGLQHHGDPIEFHNIWVKDLANAD